MLQQEGIDDDYQHDRGHKEVDYDRTGQQKVDHKEVVDQEKGGHRRLVVCFSRRITVSYSVTASFAALGRGFRHFGEGASNRSLPKVSALYMDGYEALIT